jgi:hypothetical protein
MIEVAILDVVERLLSVTPPMPLASVSPVAYQIGGTAMGQIYSADSTVASSLGQSLANNAGPVYPSPDFTKAWIGCNAAQWPSGKCMLFDLAAETIAFDDTGARSLIQIITDNVGTVWAQATVGYGLYKRTGAGIWTQMLTDTGVAVGVRYRASDNTYWYQSSSSNHYQLANGAATLQSAPTGTLIVVPVSTCFLNLDAPYFTGSNNPAFSGPAAVFYNADGTVNALPTLAMEAYVNAGAGAAAFAATQIHLDATYSVLVQVPSVGGTYPAYALYVMNKTTGVIKFIGCLPPTSLKGTTAGNCSVMGAFAAKWIGNGFRLYFKGATVNNVNITTAGSQGGVVKIDVPYQPNF